jgi:hypothetical protein
MESGAELVPLAGRTDGVLLLSPACRFLAEVEACINTRKEKGGAETLCWLD